MELEYTGKIFVIGDIHGAHKALIQCLERSNFDVEKDILVSLGDLVDSFPDSFECVETLLKVKNLIAIRGNHDQWMLEYLTMGRSPDIWLTQGGLATLKSYRENYDVERLKIHEEFFKSQIPYFHDTLKRRFFVHGGFSFLGVSETPYDTFMWDRSLWYESLKKEKEEFYTTNFRDGVIDQFKEIYIGHTDSGQRHPVKAGNVWNMDSGAGWSGVLSIMDVDSKEFWISDPVKELYPNKGRG
jgi:serine/threonine protein phosphatase 1